MTQITIDPTTAQTAASICALVAVGDLPGALVLTDGDPLPAVTALMMGQTLAGSLGTDSRTFDWEAIAHAFRTMSAQASDDLN